ncbi:hypothetical protein BDBG_00637 [Blastomyces gilchristii SLH14081]|uniref:DUF8035 domain-containing protein n=1 Tax=Blastomyces gilchristii (strain SLH14081) TaxID=559298 RepID=A0A179U9L9_BLAGS|nr:uncharacterized protein BDBG_00637 [Blastomyces gilchristii SLH14081]OAT03999.1 hypothetical protein BDBG_00637 [Blastomyces gilchristii SLH14081]
MSRRGDSSSASTSSSGGGGGGGRWDAGRFFREREERQEPQARERRTQIVDRPPPAERRRRDVDELLQAAHERFGPPARRPGRTYNDEHLVPSSGAMIPFREREERDRSPPVRPQLLRRQSSLDTFDRAAARRGYDKYDREDYGPPVTPVPVPHRRRTPPTHEKVDFEEIRVAEPEYYGDEEYHRIRMRDRSVTPRPRGRSIPPSPQPVEVREIRPSTAPRRGKTRMPKRLVHPRAIIDLGYQYEEEEDAYIIFQALQEAHIEDLVTRSREVRRTATTTEITDTLTVGHPRDNLSIERRRSVSRRPATRVVERSRSRRPSVSRPEPAPVRHHRRRRSSPIRIIEPRDVVFEDVIEPRADVALIVPDRRRLGRDTQAETRALDRDRRALRSEREGALDVEETLDVRREPKAPSPRLIRAMMATLT